MIQSTKPTTHPNQPSETNACVNATMLKAVDSTGCRDRFVDQSERPCSGVDDGLLIEVEGVLALANRDAVRVSCPTEHSLPLSAKIILRRQSSWKLDSPRRMIRSDLARSLAHTLAHLS